MMEDERLVMTVMLGMVEDDQPRKRPARRWSLDNSNVTYDVYSIVAE